MYTHTYARTNFSDTQNNGDTHAATYTLVECARVVVGNTFVRAALFKNSWMRVVCA